MSSNFVCTTKSGPKIKKPFSFCPYFPSFTKGSMFAQNSVFSLQIMTLYFRSTTKWVLWVARVFEASWCIGGCNRLGGVSKYKFLENYGNFNKNCWFSPYFRIPRHGTVSKYFGGRGNGTAWHPKPGQINTTARVTRVPTNISYFVSWNYQ